MAEREPERQISFQSPPAAAGASPRRGSSPPLADKSPEASVTSASPARSAAGKPDALNSEFLYYSSVLKALCGTLTNESDRKRVLPWVQKLFRPEYHGRQFRAKRNKYLLQLTLTLLGDSLFGVFRQLPPAGALPDLDSYPKEEFPAAEWELDTSWSETLRTLPDDFERLTCPVHRTPSECDLDHDLDNILDQEFQFMLYLLRPYAALFRSTQDRAKVATWMQSLCSISGNVCSSMRGIRNDYIMLLLSYAANLRLVGPFASYPPIRRLPPLAEAAQHSAEAHEEAVLDPVGSIANDFLGAQPMPEEGAFCYIALTGDLLPANATD